MLVENKICFLLVIGLVTLATSDSKVYLLSKKGLTSVESEETSSQDLQGRDRFHLKKFVAKPRNNYTYLKSNLNKLNFEYDYDGYYRERDVNTNRFCLGANCYIYIPEKGTFIKILANRDSENMGVHNTDSVDDISDVNGKKIDDGYVRDDESNEDFDEKSATDSFEQRSDEHNADGKNEILKMEPIHIEDLYQLRNKDAVADDYVGDLFPKTRTSKEGVDINHEIGKVYTKEYLRQQRQPNEKIKAENHEGRKRGVKKSSIRKQAAKKKRINTTPPSVDNSDDSNTFNIPAEDSDTERSASQSMEMSSLKNEFNSYEVIKVKGPKHSLSLENDNFVKRDSFEMSLSEEVTPKPVVKKKAKPRIPGKPEHYMQSFSRLFKEGQDFRKRRYFNEFLMGLRKRMPHFLPKRYHWDEKDFQKLGYFWFNGPQGYIPPGPWQIGY